MTVDEIVDAALERSLEFGVNWSGARSSMYRRVGLKQMQLFALAAQRNPEYFGVCATAALDPQGKVDLADLEDAPALLAASAIQRVEIADPGTSTYAAGTEVNIIDLDDPDADYPPRATLRNFVIAGYGSDLNGVVSLKVWYSYRPRPLGPDDGKTEIELPLAYQQLLVIDLTRWLILKTVTLDHRLAIAEILTAEETPILEQFLREVQTYAVATKTRFQHVPRGHLVR